MIKRLIKLIVLIAVVVIGYSVYKYVNNGAKEVKEVELSDLKFNSISLDIGATNLHIYKADEFKIESNNDYLLYNITDKVLVIKEKSDIHVTNTDFVLNIYLPESTVYESSTLKTSAGKIVIDNLNTNTFELSIGAGSIEINGLNATGSAKITAGAGVTSISNINVNNLTFDGGTGDSTVSGIITGTNNFNCNVGVLKVNLTDSISNYTINVTEKNGIVNINKDKQKDGSIYGNGTNIVNLNANLGNIEVTVGA